MDTMKTARALRHVAAVASFSALVLTTFACKRTPEAAGSCDYRSAGGNVCLDFGEPDLAAGKKLCAVPTRTWSDKPCDLAGSIGGCRTKGEITKWVYPSDKIKTRADANSGCTAWLDAQRK
jgi:hypothetical protein